MEEQKYKIFPVVKRLIRDMGRQDPAQMLRVAVYAVTAGFYPFLAVFLPKLAIGTLEAGATESSAIS